MAARRIKPDMRWNLLSERFVFVNDTWTTALCQTM
jgi:hypothetical protein